MDALKISLDETYVSKKNQKVDIRYKKVKFFDKKKILRQQSKLAKQKRTLTPEEYAEKKAHLDQQLAYVEV